MKKYITAVLIALVIISVIFYLKWDWVLANDELAAAFLTSSVLILALVGALLTLSAMRHDRATSIAMNLREFYESGTVFEGRILAGHIQKLQRARGIKNKQDSFLNTIKYLRQNNPDVFMKLISIPALFDLAGWLVRRGCCEAAAIDEQIAWEAHYEMWELYIRWIQEKKSKELLDDSPTAMYGNFVWLAKEINKT